MIIDGRVGRRVVITTNNGMMPVSANTNFSAALNWQRFSTSCASTFEGGRDISITGTKMAKILMPHPWDGTAEHGHLIRPRLTEVPLEAFRRKYPNQPPRTLFSSIARFWFRVHVTENTDQCWEWSGCGNGRYGFVFWPPEKKQRYTHRIAYGLVYGTIKLGMLVCHKCDNPPCCNPNHLFAGTGVDNAQDALRRGKYPTFRGVDHPNSKLTEEMVVAIRAINNASDTEIGAQFGVNAQTIFNVRHRNSWKHVS